MTVPRTAAATYGTQSPGCRYNSVLHSDGLFLTGEGSDSGINIAEEGYGGVMIKWELGMMESRSVILLIFDDTPTERRYYVSFRPTRASEGSYFDVIVCTAQTDVRVW